MAGNIGSGRLLQRGVAPSRLLRIGFTTMALCAIATFAGSGDGGLSPALRYAAVLLFSGVGGLIPATLFALAVRLAPTEGTLSTTVGWVQQWSAFGQFAGPPLVAAVASRSGDWQWTWAVTGACSIVGLLLTVALSRLSLQQWSAFGQFAGPPLVAAVASTRGDWQWTWTVTGACSIVGLLLTVALSRLPAQR